MYQELIGTLLKNKIFSIEANTKKFRLYGTNSTNWDPRADFWNVGIFWAWLGQFRILEKNSHI